MKSAEFIKEAVTSLSGFDPRLEQEKWFKMIELQSQAIAPILARECSIYLNQIKKGNRPMYRGMGRLPSGMLTKRSGKRSAKMAVPQTVEYHHAADNWFLKNTGVRFRSDAIYTTGSYGKAEDYGKVGVIFPIGNFQFCWSPKYDSMLESLKEFGAVGTSGEILSEGQFYKGLAAGKYQTTDLSAALNSLNEVMVHCESFYIIGSADADQIIPSVMQLLGK